MRRTRQPVDVVPFDMDRVLSGEAEVIVRLPDGRWVTGHLVTGQMIVPLGPFLTEPSVGRPPGITTIENDEQIRGPVREMRRDGRKITQEAVAAYTGTFTVYELRGYLRVTRRTWREFLRSF